jgi:transcriptional regulator with XRE-family HTH domain
MGDVIGLGRRRPNGAKIANLRREKGLKQADFAKKGVSERVLREIERHNHPVPATTITAIATALQTTPDEITLSTPDGTLASSVPLLKLTAIRSAKDLNALASDTTEFEYVLEVDPSPVTAPTMQALMMIVRRLVQPYENQDEFDRQHFGAIPRLAQLQELLGQLFEHGVGVIAGKYVRRSLKRTKDADFVDEPIPDTEWSIKTQFILRLHFVPAEKQEGDIRINSGKPLDRLLEEARRWTDDDRKLSPGGKMDDEIPF